MTIREIFEQASALEGERRDDYLRRVCADDDQRSQVSRMLDLLDGNDAFLETPVLDQSTRDAILDRAEDPVPERLGRYHIIARRGAGGMGTIYEAAQESPKRRVALKLIHADLAGRQARERFALEADVLGRLHHPGIAQIYEAGVAELDGHTRPFIAMELIEGEHIDAYAKTLDAPDRLRLVALVADAVHHAHMRGVIHRDLKASNVLVDAEGRPKIVDFGVARLVEHDPCLTRTAAPVGTVAAMSPEQLAGSDDIDTRSDVYALGALAYLILAGRSAHDLSHVGIADAARILREHEPARLRDVDGAIDPDVDTIVRTAMAPDRDRRYASAAAFSADIRRCLAHRPIEARRPTLRYQFGRWARRHRAVAAGLGVGLAALLLATVGTSAALVWAVNERRAADARAADAETALQFLQDMLTSAKPAALGRDARVIEVLAMASATLAEGLDDQPLLEARLRHMIAETYQALGEHDVAEMHLRRALSLRETGLGDHAPDTLQTRHTLAYSLVKSSRYDEAEPLIADVLDIRRHRLGPRDVKTLESMHVLGLLLEFDGRYDEAHGVLAELQTGAHTLGRDHPLAMTADNCMANLQLHLGNAEQARDLHADTLRRRTDALGREHPDTLQSLGNLGGVHVELGDLNQAETILREAAELSDHVRGPLHPQTLTTKANLAVVLRRLNQVDAARTLLEQVLADREHILGPHHIETIIAMGNLASIHVQQRDDEKAARVLQVAVERADVGDLGDHPTTGRLLLMHARVLDELGRRADALDALDRAESILVAAHGDDGRAMCAPIRARLSD